MTKKRQKTAILDVCLEEAVRQLQRASEELKTFDKKRISTGDYTYTLYKRNGRLLLYRAGKGKKGVVKKLGREDVVRLRAVKGGKDFLNEVKRLTLLARAIEDGALEAVELTEKVRKYSHHLNELALYVNEKTKLPVSGRLSLRRVKDGYGVARLLWVWKDSRKFLSHRDFYELRNLFHNISPATGRFFEKTSAAMLDLAQKRRNAKRKLERALKALKILIREGIITLPDRECGEELK